MTRAEERPDDGGAASRIPERGSQPAAAETPGSDFTDCDREPIHLLGKVQPHGALLVFHPRDLVVLRASSNAAAFLRDSASPAASSASATPAPVLGRRLDELFHGELVEQLAGAAQEGPVRFANPLTLRLADGAGHSLTCIAHRTDELVVLEFEPATRGDAGGLTARSIDPYFDLVHRLLRRIEDCGTVAQMADVVARHAREFTGFDRVMVYRFHPDGHGEVISEASRDESEAYLGLHFPASDIPSQARALYRRNLVRLIVDVDAPALSVEASGDAPVEPLDLSDAILRSVSEVHLQYLRNMGVRASMSVSLLHHGELWGMLLFHHESPRFVPFSVRGACELLGAVITPRLAWQELEFERLRARENHASVESAMRTLVEERFGEEATDRALLVLTRLFEASGACLRRDGHDHLYGHVAGQAVRDRLLDAVYDHGTDRVYATDVLAAHAHDEAEVRSLGELRGALAVLAYDDVGMIFFRQPERYAVRWAGDPSAAVEGSATGGSPQPRASFREFVEERTQAPRPWSADERELARALRSMLMSATVYELDAMEDRLEARMRELTGQALRRGRLHAMVEVAEISFWELEPSSRRFTDTHWLRVLGYEPGDVEPTLDGIREVLHPEDAERVLAALGEFATSGDERLDLAARFVAADGSVQSFHTRSRVTQRAVDGSAGRLLGVLFPMDNVAAASPSSQRRSDELESLIHAISHDLKSPLVTCQGFVGLARQGLDTGDIDGARNDLERIDAAAQKMGRIIDDLLTMSRIGRVAFLKAPLDVAQLFRETAEGLAQRAYEQGVELVVEEQAPLIVGDRASLSRALENLLSNALKYGCPDGGRVELGALRAGDEVRLFVRDDGPGIEPRFHERIFELFARLHSDSQGTGVGLASVAKVAQVHEGRAWVTSAPGEGATFWIGLPAPAAAAGTPRQPGRGADEER